MAEGASGSCRSIESILRDRRCQLRENAIVIMPRGNDEVGLGFGFLGPPPSQAVAVSLGKGRERQDNLDKDKVGFPKIG